jgi:TIR domain
VKNQDTLQPIELFYSYAHQDERLRKRLEIHLSALRQQGVITEWYDRKIIAGSDWKQSIDAHLMAAKIILLLISPDFLDSDYCYGVEVQKALARHAKGEACVIPVMLCPVDWEGAPFAHIQCVPSPDRPVTTWANRDEAFREVAKAIRKAIEQLRPQQPSSPPVQHLVPSLSPAPTVAPVQGAPAAYHSCVLSYATEDEPFVTKLYADLQAQGVPCWLAEQDGKLGDKLRADIYRAIRQKEKLLLILSQNAIESTWVEEEVDVALDREHQQSGTLMLFPVRLDESVFTTEKYWAITVRQRRIGDFRQWQNDAEYQRALQRLLRDLQV